MKRLEELGLFGLERRRLRWGVIIDFRYRNILLREW